MTEAHTRIIPVQGSLEDARSRASAIVAETNREMTAVRIFEQGERKMLSGVLPVRVLTRILDYNAAPKGTTADKALTATNRPVVAEHVRGIASYLHRTIEKDENYIIPPLTLNSTGDVEVLVPEGQYEVNSGYAVFPDETSVHITDGQHRFLAIKQVADEMRGTPQGAKFMGAGVPFMMTIESETGQVHQDFADAGKTKALPPSLLAVYDTRQPANRAVIEICERVPLMKGRIDATSSTLSAGSPFIFLVNQVRQFVKHSLTGSTSTKEPQFAEQAEAAMSNIESRERWIKSRVAFLKAMTDIIPEWRELAELSPPGGADAASVLERTKEIKQRMMVPLNGAFLTTIGLVSHTVLKDVTSADRDEADLIAELQDRLIPFKEIRWDRSAEIWDGNVVTGGKIRTQGPAVRAASQKMLDLLETKTYSNQC